MEIGNYVFNLFDEFNKDDVSEEKLSELDDDMRSLLSDKDSLNSSVNTSSETEKGKLLSKEEGIQNNIKSNMKALFDKINKDEIDRNHTRVTEIHNYIEEQKKNV